MCVCLPQPPAAIISGIAVVEMQSTTITTQKTLNTRPPNGTAAKPRTNRNMPATTTTTATHLLEKVVLVTHIENRSTILVEQAVRETHHLQAARFAN